MPACGYVNQNRISASEVSLMCMNSVLCGWLVLCTDLNMLLFFPLITDSAYISWDEATHYA